MSAPMPDSPSAYTGIHERIFRITNIFDFRTNSPFWAKWHGPILYTLRAIFVYFGCTLQFCSLFTSESIIELSTVLFIVTIWVNIAIKDICFIVKKRDIIKLWQQLDDDDFKARTDGEFQCVISAYKSIRLVNALGMLIIVCVQPFALAPYLIKKLPYMLWTPFDQYGSYSTYMTMYFVEILTVIVVCSMVLCINGYILLVLICLDYNYNLLSERAAHVGHQSSRKKYQYIESYGKMVELIKLHMKMNRLMGTVNELFNEVFLVQILQAAVCFANCAYLVLMVDIEFGLIFPLLCLIVFVPEMFFYCYFCTRITSTYDSVSEKANFADILYSGDMETGKALALLVYIIDSRPMKIETVSIVRYEMTLEMFLVIVKTTYSIVMLLAEI